MTEPVVNGIEVDMCSSPNSWDSTVHNLKYRFLSSFLIDARGGSVRGSRHSGVHIIIPAGKVCMPTRITCKLVKSNKLSVPPPLKEGEAVVSRVLELGPVGIQFNGPVLIELPHVASLHNNERDVVALRSDDGLTWHEHPVSPVDIINGLLRNPVIGENEHVTSKPTISIVSTDFPRYFALISRVRQVSRVIGPAGGSLTSETVQAVSTVFPVGSVTKDTKVGLQALPVSTESVKLVLGSAGQSYGTSPVITVEPRRRRFHAPISLTIPLPPTACRRSGKQQADGIRLLYSITGGINRSKWEDITGSAPMNIINDCVSFSTTVSARFWLVDVGAAMPPDAEEIVDTATDVYAEVIAVPILAQFVVYARRHHETEAQLRVLCLTNDVDTTTTLEYQEKFHEISRSEPVELQEGKSYCVELTGNLVPAAASSSQLGIEVHAFRINRLSFVVRLRDNHQLPEANLKFLPAAKVTHGLEVQQGVPVCSLPISLVEAKPTGFLAEHEPDDLERKFEVAKQQIALAKELEQEEGPGTGVTLRLGDVATALQSDWISLAKQLGITDPEVVKIQKEFGSIGEQAMIMLHLWVAKSGRLSGNELESGLTRIGREDIIKRCIHNTGDPSQLMNGSLHEGVVQPIDSPSDDSSPHNTFGVESYMLKENGHGAVGGGEVEAGAVYQIEEVWDGNQWHKSMKMVPKQGEDGLVEGVSVSIIEKQTDKSDEVSASIENQPQPEFSIEQAVVQSSEPDVVPMSISVQETESPAQTETNVKGSFNTDDEIAEVSPLSPAPDIVITSATDAVENDVGSFDGDYTVEVANGNAAQSEDTTPVPESPIGVEMAITEAPKNLP